MKRISVCGRYELLCAYFLAFIFNIPQANADLTVTLSEAMDGTTDVEFSGSGTTAGNGSATFSVTFADQFLGSNDNSDFFGILGTLSGTVGGEVVEFVPGLRILDGAASDTFQFTFATGAPFPWHDADDPFLFSGKGNFTNLPFSMFISNGTFTSTSGDALDFAEFSLFVVPSIKFTTVNVTTNITVVATGASGWSFEPDFSTNLSAVPQSWIPITPFNSTDINGTNTISFDNPNAGPNLYFRIRGMEP